MLVGNMDEVQLAEALEAEHDHEQLSKVILWGLGEVILEKHRGEEGEQSKETRVNNHSEGDCPFDCHKAFLWRHE